MSLSKIHWSDLTEKMSRHEFSRTKHLIKIQGLLYTIKFLEVLRAFSIKAVSAVQIMFVLKICCTDHIKAIFTSLLCTWCFYAEQPAGRPGICYCIVICTSKFKAQYFIKFFEYTISFCLKLMFLETWLIKIKLKSHYC